MRKKVIAFVLASAGLLPAAGVQTFTGRITDTMCVAKHGMMKGQPDDACVRMCVKNTSSVYALYDGKSALRLSDQKIPAQFAGREVKVSGTYNEQTNTIKVTSIELAAP